MTFSARATLAAAALAIPFTLAGAAQAASSDGLWTVIIITEAGNCDAAYSYPFRVSRGRITSAGSFDISGRVNGGGGVQVRISAGGSVANGTGRLGAGS